MVNKAFLEAPKTNREEEVGRDIVDPEAIARYEAATAAAAKLAGPGAVRPTIPAPELGLTWNEKREISKEQGIPPEIVGMSPAERWNAR